MATFHDTSETIDIPLTQGYVAFVDVVDGDLGQFKWYVQRNGEKAYGRRSVKHRVTVLLHRLVLERKIGRSLTKGECVDHIDGNTLNNCRANLRVATHQQNMWNHPRHRNNKSGYKGVIWEEQRRTWRAMIRVDGKTKPLGRYATKEEAYAAYCEAAIKYHGEFANFGK